MSELLLPKQKQLLTESHNHNNNNNNIDQSRCCFFPPFSCWYSYRHHGSNQRRNANINRISDGSTTRGIRTDNQNNAVFIFDSMTLNEKIEELSDCMKDVFENYSHDLVLSKDLINALLREEEGDDEDDNNDDNDDGESENTDRNRVESEKNYYKSHHIEDMDNDDNYVLKGLPCRPFYKVLSIRIILLTQLYFKNYSTKMKNRKNDPYNDYDDHQEEEGKDEEGIITLQSKKNQLPRSLINATELGFTENTPLPILEPFFVRSDNDITISNVTEYLNKIQTEGIFEYLGLRSTIGTIGNDNSTNDSCGGGGDVYLNLIPNPKTLLRAANQPCKPKSNTPRLSVAGRARAKHAHRGAEDQYFGICKGSTKEKNDAATQIVLDMIQSAVWINVHIFGGVDVPVLEIRTKQGYGVRWGIIQKSKGDDMDDQSDENESRIVFRGFLEPQMNDGFEKKWRH